MRFGAVSVQPGAFRLLLAATVVVSHLTRFDIGRLAVLLFFFLSGYWTIRIWREKFGEGSTLRFYAARYLRIAPLCLVVMLAASWVRGKPWGFENIAIFGLASSDRDPLGVAWSLDVELQFYLLFPLIAGFVGEAPWIILSGSIVSGAAVWIADDVLGVVTVLNYLPAFLLGVLTYSLKWKPSQRVAMISVGAFLLVTFCAAMTPFIDKTIPDPFDRDIFAFFWMLPLLPFVAWSLTKKSSKLDRHLGNISYPLYLVHYTVIDVVATGGLGTKVLAATVAIILAVGIYLLIDRPIDRWRVLITEVAAKRVGRPGITRSEAEKA